MGKHNLILSVALVFAIGSLAGCCTHPAPPPSLPPPPPPPVVTNYVVFFDFDKADITPEAQAVLSDAAKTAKSSGNVHVQIVGHTDTVGSAAYNMSLSVQRADAVKVELVNDGLSADDIATSGRGFSDPLVPTGPGVREPQNRRAVIDLNP
jgi:outer membrane protein OmpA-like peptidoglycan-associated protein